MKRDKNAFTLMEVTIVVVILGILSTFMIPNFSKAIDKADERNIIANLATIRAAVDMYVGAGGTVGAWNSLNEINSNLRLRILDTKATYACQNSGGITNGCTATHPKGWAIQFHDEHSTRLLHCSAGTCPSCPAHNENCG